MEHAGRFSILKDKIEIDIFSSELSLFEEFINKISQQSFDFILNNFDFIGAHKSGIVPNGKKALTFSYGNYRMERKCPIEIRLQHCNFYNDLYIPNNEGHVIVKFQNNYGIVAVADVRGNLYCNDLYHYTEDENDNCHLLFDNLISKYKEIEFPIARFAELMLTNRLNDIQSITKDFKIDVKIVKTTIDKKKAIKMLKTELFSIESSLHAYYSALLREKDNRINKLESTIEQLKEKSFQYSMQIVADLLKNKLELTLEYNRLLIDCSKIKVTKLKRNNIIYELPEDCQVFKIGTIVVPFNALSLKDCKVIKETSFHPNINDNPCYGEHFYKLEDIAAAIKQFETINLDNSFDNDAEKKALQIFETKLRDQIEGKRIWTL